MRTCHSYDTLKFLGLGASSPMDIYIVRSATACQLRDVAVGGLLSLGLSERKSLLDAAPSQVYGCHGLMLRLAQPAQQVVQRQPSKCALVSTWSVKLLQLKESMCGWQGCLLPAVVILLVQWCMARQRSELLIR